MLIALTYNPSSSIGGFLGVNLGATPVLRVPDVLATLVISLLLLRNIAKRALAYRAHEPETFHQFDPVSSSSASPRPTVCFADYLFLFAIYSFTFKKHSPSLKDIHDKSIKWCTSSRQLVRPVRSCCAPCEPPWPTLPDYRSKSCPIY